MQRDWLMYHLRSTYKHRLEYPFKLSFNIHAITPVQVNHCSKLYILKLFISRIMYVLLSLLFLWWKSCTVLHGRVRTTPHEDNSPPYRFWSWWVVLFRGSGPSGECVLVGNSPRHCGPGGQWLGFIFYLEGNCAHAWGVFLEPCMAGSILDMYCMFCHIFIMLIWGK